MLFHKILRVRSPRRLFLVATVLAVALFATQARANLAPESLLVYYGYPSEINGSVTNPQAAAELGQYDHVIFGDGQGDPGHPDNANLAAILADLAMTGTQTYGFIDVSVTGANLTLPQIQTAVDQWQTTGADGVLLDSFGYEFDVSRTRQNAIVDYVHLQGMVAVVDAGDPADALGSDVDALWNPGAVAPSLTNGDFYLYTSHQIEDNTYVAEIDWQIKAEELDTLRSGLGVDILSITTTDVDDVNAYNEDKFFYSWYSALLYGHAATGWGEYEYSSEGTSNGVAPFRTRPVVNPGTSFQGSLTANGSFYQQQTDVGTVLVDAANHLVWFVSIEVSIDGTWVPLDRSVVPTSQPTVRIASTQDLGSSSVLLTREDLRAGIGGAGKLIDNCPDPIDCFVETMPGFYEATIATQVGVNTIEFEGAISATMLNFSERFEDLNDDLDLDSDEDDNGDGLLDAAEDDNGNLILDFPEDFNGNGNLDDSEDQNGNGMLDDGEDLNGNQVIDSQIAMPVLAILSPDVVTAPDGDLQDADTVILEFLPSATEADIGDFFRGSLGLNPFDLRPVGVVVSIAEPTQPKIVTARILDGTLPHQVASTLNGSSEIPPSIPPAAPLRVAFPNSIFSFAQGANTVPAASEQLPLRLWAAPGLVPNVGDIFAPTIGGFDNDANTCDNDGDGAFDEDPLEDDDGDGRFNEDPIDGFDNDNDGMTDEDPPVDTDNDGMFDEDHGSGFDDDGDGLIDEDPVDDCDNDGDGLTDEDPSDPCDELDVAWQHFFMQTFAAHRLLPFVESGLSLPPPLALAVIDSGFGNGTASLADIPGGPGGRIVRALDVVSNLAAFPPNPIATVISRGNSVASIPDPAPHGTSVASYAAGDGTALILGTGPRIPLRPIRTALSSDALNAAFVAVATDPNTAVVNLSIGIGSVGGNPLNGRRQVIAKRTQLRAGALALALTDKIIVVAAGNTGEDVAWNWGALFGVERFDGTPADDDGDGQFDEDPANYIDDDNDGIVDEDPPENLLTLAVTATGISNGPQGPERFAKFSAFGARASISAPGQNVMAVTPVTGPPTNFVLGGLWSGTSFAAPHVAGAIAELLNTARALPPGLFSGGVPKVTTTQRRSRVKELVLGSADDLGTTGAPGFVNDDAGDGPDEFFGHGRLNMWKAALSVANQGLAKQHAREDSDMDGMDDRFTDLPLIADADTEWYGFEIITSERQATVWLDGDLVEDAGPDGIVGNADDPMVPLAPLVTAYKGVSAESRIERGVHTLYDGFDQDPGTAAAPGAIVEEDPTSGIVPVGTSLPGRGLYVMTFSIRRSDLYSGATPKTLSLRKEGADRTHKPFFNLKLDTEEMRTGRVSGVTFDDFVYQIVVPDYGDSQIGPSKMTDNGARHHNTALEWLGKLTIPNLKSVTGEHNAEQEPTGGSALVDVDGVSNLAPDNLHDRDGRDDGVLFFPLTYAPGAGNPGKVMFTVGVADPNSPRYSVDDDRSLYANLWIDWNTNGIFEEANDEHVLDGVQINPAGPWVVVNQGGSGSATTLFQTGNPEGRTAKFEGAIPVGSIGTGSLWARMRLDYGENVGRNDPRPHFRSLSSLRNPNLDEGVVQPAGAGRGYVNGAARYGEVEDYLIATDFGDAADVSCSQGVPPVPNQYPTCKINLGARHLDTNKESLGTGFLTIFDVTREIDAGPNGVDEDGVPNLASEQTDFADTGVEFTRGFFPILQPFSFVKVTTVASVEAYGISNAAPTSTPETVGVPEDDADSLPRYGGDPKRQLYLSGWADWNANSTWEPGEKIVNAILDPATWGPDGQYTLGEAFEDANFNGVFDAGETYTEQFGTQVNTQEYLVVLPPVIPPRYSLRFRLSYGEDEGQTLDLDVRENDETGRAHGEATGGALFGEVEDYLSFCGNGFPDFGEFCDLGALDGQTCQTLGYSVGTLACLPGCDGYDVTGCSTCGDGNLDGGEDCDDGNTVGGDCCSATCTFESSGSPCGDELSCIAGGTCNGAGSCTNGDNFICADGNACTDDFCSVGIGCQTTDNNDPCSDGDGCTVNDVCSGGTCVGGGAKNCSDLDSCTTDSCVAGNCQSTPIPDCSIPQDMPGSSALARLITVALMLGVGFWILWRRAGS